MGKLKKKKIGVRIIHCNGGLEDSYKDFGINTAAPEATFLSNLQLGTICRFNLPNWLKSGSLMPTIKK